MKIQLITVNNNENIRMHISNMTAYTCVYRQPVYVDIYLPLAPAHSNYRLETSDLPQVTGKTLSHNDVLSTPRHEQDSNSQR
jgi:hypothetical protein